MARFDSYRDDPDARAGDMARFGRYRDDPEARKRLAKDKVDVIRINIAWLLGELGDQRAIPALVACLQEQTSCSTHGSFREGTNTIHWDGGEKLSVVAAHSLVKLRAIESVPALKVALQEASDSTVKEGLSEAIQALEKGDEPFYEK